VVDPRIVELSAEGSAGPSVVSFQRATVIASELVLVLAVCLCGRSACPKLTLQMGEESEESRQSLGCPGRGVRRPASGSGHRAPILQSALTEQVDHIHFQVLHRDLATLSPRSTTASCWGS